VCLIIEGGTNVLMGNTRHFLRKKNIGEKWYLPKMQVKHDEWAFLKVQQKT